MNTKRWLLASVAVLVVIMVLEFVIHGVLLQGVYQQTASVWRTQADMQRLMWIFWMGYLVFAPFFTEAEGQTRYFQLSASIGVHRRRIQTPRQRAEDLSPVME
jgi:hypothetical protein